MSDNDFRYDLNCAPEYLTEYFRVYNEWRDAVACFSFAEYEKQILSRDYSAPAWKLEQDYLLKRNAALDKMTDAQVIELINHYSDQMTGFALTIYLSKRQKQRTAPCAPAD